MRQILGLILALGLLAAGPPLGAQTAEPKLVRVGYTEFRPFSETSAEGIAQGISIDMLRTLLEPRGYLLEFVRAENPARMLEMLSGGEIDTTTLLAIREDRAEVGDFTRPATSLGVGVFYDANTGGPMTEAGMAGLRVGVSRGSFPAAIVADRPELLRVDFQTSNDLLLVLISGEVDAVAAPVAAFRHLALSTGLGERVLDGPVLHRSDAAFLVSPNRGSLRADLDAALEQAEARGSLARIEAQWLSASDTAASGWRLATFALLGAMALALGAAAARGGCVLRRRARVATLYEEAFRGLGHTFSAFEPSGRLFHVSPGFLRIYPYLQNVVRERGTLHDMIQRVQSGGHGDIRVAESDARGIADERMERLNGGETLSYENTTPEGLTQLRRTFRSAEGWYFGVTTDITPLQRVRAEAQTRIDRLEEDNRRLQDFTSVAAHDLRAPLRNLRLLIEWIVEELTEGGHRLADPVHEKIEMVETLLDQQARLIGDLLTYARGAQSEDSEDFDPMTRIEEIVSLAGLPERFEVAVENILPPLHANPTAFDTVMRNLIANAGRHHDRSRGRIALRAVLDGQTCAIHVIDDGPGLPPEVRRKVFQPFYRHNQEAEGGTGLGLALVEREVRAWGGEIVCLARSDGMRGAEFVLTVPRARSMRVAETVPALPPPYRIGTSAEDGDAPPRKQ